MPDGIEVVNSLVEEKALELKNQQQAQETPDQKVAREAAEAEKSKQQQQQSETPEQKTARETEEKKVADQKLAEDQNKPLISDSVAELLKETNFESREALIDHLKKKDKKTKSPEEAKREQEVYRANLNQFAVENELMSNEDIVKLETLKQKADKDLVYESFASDIRAEIEEEEKAANPDVTQSEIDERIKEVFEKEFPLESKNKKAKERAERRLEKSAKEIRGPLESSFTDAKTRYDEELAIRNAYPDYQKTIQKIAAESLPKSVPFFSQKDGDEDVPVEIPITEADQKEILDSLSKNLSTPENYMLFKDGKVDGIKKQAHDQLEYIIWKKFSQVGKEKIAEKFLSRGIKKGSTTGAEQSFELNQSKNKAADKVSATSKEEQILNSTRQKQ